MFLSREYATSSGHLSPNTWTSREKNESRRESRRESCIGSDPRLSARLLAILFGKKSLAKSFTESLTESLGMTLNGTVGETLRETFRAKDSARYSKTRFLRGLLGGKAFCYNIQVTLHSSPWNRYWRSFVLRKRERRRCNWTDQVGVEMPPDSRWNESEFARPSNVTTNRTDEFLRYELTVCAIHRSLHGSSSCFCGRILPQ